MSFVSFSQVDVHMMMYTRIDIVVSLAWCRVVAGRIEQADVAGQMRWHSVAALELGCLLDTHAFKRMRW